MTRRKISVVLICLILLSVVPVRGQFVEGKEIQRGNDNQSPSLSEQEITEEVNKKHRSSFVENKGQVGNDEIIFYGSLPNGKIAFGESKVMLWMEGMNEVVTLYFENSHKVSPIGLGELGTKSNYFLGDRGMFTNVKSFGTIIYYDLWKGIDLYYQATPKGAKYEFRVAPGAKPEDISISCEGQEQLFIGKDSLTIMKGEGRFVDEGLMVLQEGEEINGKFVNKGDNTFGFQINKYDQNKPLVIDPLIYSTFVGGSGEDYGVSLALDGEGNAYVTGKTSSSNFPTTANAYDSTLGGLYFSDCFVFKLSANGSSLLYSTYVGGSGIDSGVSLALDGEGNAYVTGETVSSDFPTTPNAYDSTLGGLRDCFVFKLSANGSSLLYSTYVGGSSYDTGKSLALDGEGKAYVTGNTYSSNFPTTPNAYDSTLGGLRDCFVFKLSADGSSLLYSTFVGGNDGDSGFSIALDSQGNTYVTGVTASSNFPTTPNAYDSTLDGIFDCFVFKLSADGSSLLYSTYVGGSKEEFGQSLALDGEGNAYVTGETVSSDFPTTPNAYDSTLGGEIDWDCFVFKLSADGSSLLYSTFVGGSNIDYGVSLALDGEGNAYVTGYTHSSDFPTTPNAYNSTLGGLYPSDCFVFKLSSNGSSLLYSTFVGGSDDDSGSSIALDGEGNAYVTGDTQSSNFPTTVNAYDSTLDGFFDCFVFKLPIEDAPSPTITLTPTVDSGLIIWFISPLGFVFIITLIVYRKKKIR